jgi:cytoskeletal protein RodZ
MEALGYDNLPLLWLLRAVDVANRAIPYEDAKAQVDLWQEVQAAQPRSKRPKLAPCTSADDEEAEDGHTTPATSEDVRSDTPCEHQQRSSSQVLGAAPRSSLGPAAAAAQPAAPACSKSHQVGERHMYKSEALFLCRL